MSNCRSFEEFFQVIVVLYRTIGIEFFDHRSASDQSGIKAMLLKLLFYAGFINFNMLLVGELIYFIQALRSHATILEATAVAPFIGLAVVADFMQLALVVHKNLFRHHLSELERIFPARTAEQLAYKLPQHESRMRRNTILFASICVTTTTTFSLFPICQSAVRYWFLGAAPFQRTFGFFIWYPYNATQSRLVYAATYLSQIHGIYMPGVVFVSADLMFVAMVTQICMHLGYIAECLEHLETSGDHENIGMLQQLAAHHATCFRLSDDVNRIFSFALLLNFMAASLAICFTGFQMTASSIEDLVMYLIFLAACLVQVFVVCYYGQELRTASSRIASAAYNQNWFDSSVKYKKMLCFVMMRSQKDAAIHPPAMPPISLETYMKVISLSYQFYTLLRTIYQK